MLFSLLCPPSVHAQEPLVGQKEARVAPASLGEGWLWIDAGPRTVLDVVDTSIHPQNPSIWSTIAGDGSTWVTTDAGGRWFYVLGPIGRPNQDEEAITEVEARLGELSGSVDVPDESLLEDGELSEDEFEEALEQVAEDAQNDAQQIIDEVQSEIEAGPWFLPEKSAGSQLRPRVQFTRSGLLVVARSDGLYLSEDLGSTWHHVFEEPTTSFVEIEGGGFVVGTPAGALWSATLLDWIPIPSLEGREIRDIVDGGGVWASTETGLWWSADGRDFALQTAWFDEVWTALPLPALGSAPRVVVLSARDGVWQASDPARLPAVASVAPEQVEMALSFARRDDGLLLAAARGGPFESLDSGASWHSLGVGLETLAVTDIEVSGAVVLLSASDGIKRRVPVTPVPDTVGVPDWIPLSVLVDEATHRDELAIRSGSRIARALMPELSVEYVHNQVVGDDWHAATWTIREVDTWWSARIKLTWRPGLSASSSDGEDFADDLALMVFDDEIVLDDGSMTALIGTKVDRNASAYREELASTIRRLYMTRQRIALDEQWIADETLYETVLRTLQLDEIDARLDALTDGAVSRWDNKSSGERP